MARGLRYSWFWLVWLGLSVGCGGPKTYDLYFELSDPINAPDSSDPRNHKPLVVEVVCMTPTDAEDYPMMLNGGWQSATWFDKRGNTADPELGKLLPRIHGFGSCQGSNRLGDALISPSDMGGQPRVGPFSVTHPEPDKDASAIVVYARFIGDGKLMPTSPVIIPLKQPMSGPGGVPSGKINIKVGATSISRGS